MEKQCGWFRGLAAVLAAGLLALAGCAGAGARRTGTFAGKGGIHLATAKAELMAGDTVAAKEALKKALKKGPSAEAHYYLALVEVTQGAGGDFKTALSEV